MVAEGRVVSTVKLPELMVPLPAFPARSVTPALFRLICPVLAFTLAPGVKVAVHVMPPSLLLTGLSVPFGTFRSLLSKPLTASLKVMVTSEVSPTDSVLSATTIVAVGAAESTA
ncbi:hypothetical protein ALP75_202325 [Pseudomonas syringae pv. actinidiae]|nr:hypothetical protein ALP75_202325 [Pseudomonas syringae pv. actinidiae]